MARYRTKVVEPSGQFHSDDPRQTSMFVAEEVATAGRPAVEGDEAVERAMEESFANRAGTAAIMSAAYIDAMKRAHFTMHATVDRLAEEVRRVTGSGPRLYLLASPPPSVPAGRLVRVDWLSCADVDLRARFGFFRDARSALLHALEHERILVADGRDAADLYHSKARCRTESEAVARMDEEDGVVREDPNRNNPKYKHGDR